MAIGAILTGLSKAQRFLVVGLGGALLTTLIGLGIAIWLILSLQEEKGILEQENSQHKQTITDLNTQVQDLREEARKVDDLIVTRDREVRELRRELRWSENELKSYMEQQAKEWSDTRVPSGVYQRLFPSKPNRN